MRSSSKYRPLFNYVIATVAIIVIAAGVLIALWYSFERAQDDIQDLIENYHFRSLTLVKQLDEAADGLDRLTYDSTVVPAASRYQVGASGLVYSLQTGVSNLQKLQDKYRGAAFEATLGRLSDRLQRMDELPDGTDPTAKIFAHLGMLKVNIEQLDRLHSIAAEDLLDSVKAKRRLRDQAALGFFMAIMGIAAILTWYLTLRLRVTLKRQEDAEQALASSRERVHQMQKLEALGQLVGGVAHDFNNLLTPILGLTGLLRMRRHADEQTDRDLAQIEIAAEQAASLTKQLLAFSQSKPVDARTIDLNDLICNMESMLRRLIGEKIEVIVACNSNNALIDLEPSHAEQVVMNLCVNARDAMPNGGELLIQTDDIDIDASVAELSGTPPGRYVRLRVADTGIGMDDETRAHLFEPFFTTKPRGRGTGLGLATLHGIVSSGRGLVVVDSRPGEGACFDIFFPRSAQRPVVETTDSSDTIHDDGQRTVLIAEDEEQIIDFLRVGLGTRGFRVLAASSASAGLDICASETSRIDVIVSDVIMPDMNGPQFVERALKLRPDAAVIYMSGYTDDIVGRSGAARHEFPIIMKPFKLDALVRLIREQIRKRSENRVHSRVVTG